MNKKYVLLFFAIGCIVAFITAARRNKVNKDDLKQVTASAEAVKKDIVGLRATVDEAVAASDEEAPHHEDGPAAGEEAPEREIVKGEVVLAIEAIGYVYVRNQVPLKGDGFTLHYGGGCTVPDEGALTVVGISPDFVLLRFRPGIVINPRRQAPREEAGGEDPVTCPTGTVFLLAKDEYLKKTEQFDNDTIEMLLKQEKR